MSKQSYKRHRFWIDPQLQMRYIFFNVVFLLIFSLVIGGAMYFGIWRSVTKEFSYVRLHEDLRTITRMREYEAARTHQAIEAVPFLKEDAKALSGHQKETLNLILVTTNKNLIPIIIAMLVFIIMSSIVLSHRFAGPIFRLKRSLSAVSGGDLTVSFSLRKRDELKTLATEIEQTVSHFSHTIASARDLIARAESAPTEEERNKHLKDIHRIMSHYKIRG